MQSSSKCAVCGEGGHKPSRCKALRIPPEGFFTGGDGGGGHGGDDEDEALEQITTLIYVSQQQIQNGLVGDESQPTQQVRTLAPHSSPSIPSSALV